MQMQAVTASKLNRCKRKTVQLEYSPAAKQKVQQQARWKWNWKWKNNRERTASLGIVVVGGRIFSRIGCLPSLIANVSVNSGRTAINQNSWRSHLDDSTLNPNQCIFCNNLIKWERSKEYINTVIRYCMRMGEGNNHVQYSHPFS